MLKPFTQNQNEFPVTSYKTVVKSKKKRFKKRARNSHDSDDSDGEPHTSSLPREKKKKKENQSEQGSYDLLDEKYIFSEVDIPYLLRRRYDNIDKKSLGKSWSCCDEKKPNHTRLVSYCSLGDLPNPTSYGWLDHSLPEVNLSSSLPKIEAPLPPEPIEEKLTDILEESSSSTPVSLVAERVVDEIIQLAEKQEELKKPPLDRRDSFQKMTSLDGIEELPLDDVKEIMNEIIDEENDENLLLSEKTNTNSPSITPKNLSASSLPPEPEAEEIDYNIETPRYPPPDSRRGSTDDNNSRRGSYDSSNEPIMPSGLLKKALMRSFSIEDAQSRPPPPRSTSLVHTTIEEELEFIDKSDLDPPEPLYDSIPIEQPSIEDSSSSAPLQILYKTRFQTLSRISERTHSSCTEHSSYADRLDSRRNREREESTLEAPLVTLTSELGDSSATLNDMEELYDEEEGGFYVEGVVLGQVQQAEVVGEDEGDSCSGESNTDCTSTMRKRVTIELRVFGGEIVVESGKDE